MRTRTLIAGGLAAAFLATAQPTAAATTRLVDDDGSATSTNCNGGAPASAFATISSAVAAAVAGDTIKVCPGSYAEQVIANKSLAFNGAQAGVDARDPARTGAVGTESVVTGVGNAGKTPFNVTVSNVTIDGFVIQGNSDPNNLGFGVLLGASTTGHALRNNVVQNNIAGLSLGSDNTTIERNVFQDNNQPGPLSGTGIYTDQFNAGGPVTGGVIDGNVFVGNENVGVEFGSTSSAQGASGVTVSDNHFGGNGNGFLAFNWDDSSFTRNVVTGSLGSQVLAGGGVDNSTFTENVVSNGMARGLRVGDFGGGGTNSAITMRCNSITGNAGAGLEVDAAAGAYTGTLAARFNWWGSASGPTIASNPGGTGQTIVDPGAEVAFKPFLTNAADGDAATPGFQCVPSASVADATVAEGGSGTTTVDVTVTLDVASSTKTVTVGFTTADGTALSRADYLHTSDAVTFAPGQLSKTVSVPVVGDAEFEPDETFGVKLLSPSNATIADGEGVVTITNDDSPSQPAGPPQPTGPAADLTAPLANGLKASPKSFFAATSGGSVGAAAAKKKKTGTKVSYTLSEAATTTLTVDQVLRGRVKSGKCRRESRADRTGRRCTLFKAVPGSFTHQGTVGANSFKFTGRLSGKTLKPGSYRLNAVPKDAAGNTGKVARASFKVKR